MSNLTTWRLNTSDLPALFDKIQKYGLGYDDYWFDKFRSLHESTSNYPPYNFCLLYTSPSPRDQRGSRMPSSA